MKNELPHALVLLGRTYRVCLTPNLGAGDHEYGHTNTWTGEIHIDAALSKQAQWATFCHEVIHVIDHALALGLTEDTVRRLDAGLWEFIQQL